MKAIEVKDLYFEYNKDAMVLNGVSFDIEKGEYITLIGRNGSGKSTLSKLLCFLLDPLKGEIKINGIRLDEKVVKEIRRTIGIVFQNPDNQFIGATVEDDIAFGLENRNVELEKMKELVLEYSKKVNMDKYLTKAPSEISGGQKQRVAIAGILALGLKIIIFDEATSMLDPEGVEDIKNLILKMRKEDKDITFISITHNLDECVDSDRVIVLDKGQIVLDDKPNIVFKKEDELIKHGLDVPYLYKIKNALNKKELEKANSIKEVAKILCK